MVSAKLSWDDIAATRVPRATVAVWWLYQAGFVLKSEAGTTVAVDPYLSDAVLRSYNQPRAVEIPIAPSDLPVDAVLATHPHEDHLDPDSIEAFAAHPHLTFIGPASVAKVLQSRGVPAERITVVAADRPAAIADIGIRAVFARHMYAAEPTPDAIGFLLDVSGVHVYHAGDTEYDSRILAETKGVDVSLVCINGTTGNMNAHEAALLAFQQQARVAVPMHYGLWHDHDYGAGATLEPQVFVDTLRRLAPEASAQIPVPARVMLLPRPSGQ